jgi:hypothetical protein
MRLPPGPAAHEDRGFHGEAGEDPPEASRVEPGDALHQDVAESKLASSFSDVESLRVPA